MNEFRFENPPVRMYGHRPVSPETLFAADTLRRHPGQWAMIRTAEKASTLSAASQGVKGGKPRCFSPAGAFESTLRKVDGEYRLYVRYVGEES